VRLAVHGRRDAVLVNVQDDGIGITGSGSAGGGMGLLGIEERARELGGVARISSQPGKGTTLQVEIPLAQGVSA